ncbi:deoxyribose-phosphate aldolase [Pseudenhygromyxa sp. WMMC2535]|uniref:deoxyribose-phosphate aldolase n=1 Tax=Pseudenhygromyxa sp. WMMC2535 TaxID=2712867 RepID=UPI001553055E|nr:deoxyribose-phosphate aldolase [Pseudenhygromyxa sp. WMMC2535]NVB36737.1 deoxyribose-phosphate aldolase [Pseudenhygromyxa sp. WMMC2535]
MPQTCTESDIRRWRAAAVDEVSAAARVARVRKRSIKAESKDQLLRLALSMVDLTTLEGADSPERVRGLCHKALRPHPPAPQLPSCAAVCVYPSMVPTARATLGEDSPVKLAAVATAFPSGQLPLALKLEEVRQTVAAGADEIDMVINRGAFLSGDDRRVFDEIVATKQACGEAHLKVILETGELRTLDNVAAASRLAIAAGADFIKTSTGKIQPAATYEVTLVMLEAIREHYLATGVRVGMKPAGGIRTGKQALHYLAMLAEILGADWMTPALFRFGASSLANDLLRQIFWREDGYYQSPRRFSVD